MRRRWDVAHATSVCPVVWRSAGAFRTPEGLLRGVTRFIREHLAPRYNHTYAVHGPEEALPVAAAAVVGSAPPLGDPGRCPVRMGGGMGRPGARRGIAVDTAITRVVEALVRTRVSVGTWLTARATRRVRTLPVLLRSATARLPRLARRLLEALDGRELEPVSAQLPLGCWRPLRLGTAADLVCRHRITGEMHVIEVKCGFRGAYYKHCASLSAPLAHLTDAPYYQHQLQLLLTDDLYRRAYPTLRVGAPYVVRVSEEAVNLYPLDPMVAAARAAVLRMAAVTASSHAAPKRVAPAQAQPAKRRRIG